MFTIIDNDALKRKLEIIYANAQSRHAEKAIGRITRVSGMRLEAEGLSISTGTLCLVEVSANKFIHAEVIGFHGKSVYLMPMDDISGVKYGSRVMPFSNSNNVSVGMALLNRVIDAKGDPIDGKGAVEYDDVSPIAGKSINPLERSRITEPLDVGVRTINGLFTIGKGQRIGIFATSGVGKSILLGMMARFTKADIVVVGLVGERGREVKEFIEDNIGEEGMKKTVVVTSPADTTPLLRANSALLATTVAEYFRDKGLDVLLIIDSITRYAHAIREISLSAGEIPATKGFTPSVFAKLSQLIERTGVGKNGVGSITAFYTVLMDSDDYNDPISEHIRSVLDGHIVLSKKLADEGIYPAIDIEKSISRIMPQVTDKAHLKSAMYYKNLFSLYTRNKDLINMGMYQAGADKSIDEAISKKEAIYNYIIQDMHESSNYSDSIAQLSGLITK